MAELAIPLIALGSMYVVSNKKNKKEQKEGFYGNKQTTMPLHNVNPPIPTKNYPIEDSNPAKNNINKYSNPNQHTDKYFIPPGYDNDQESKVSSAVSTDNNVSYSLTGNPINQNEFKHNNMVPFFGGSVKGVTYKENDQSSELILDRHQGTGSQHFKKQEQAPMFEPVKDMQHAYGAPNNSDYLQGRVVPSTNMSMQRPFEQQRVARGLNKGFTSEGSGGFNTSLEARDAWLPKTVDQLRTTNNPKTTYELSGHEGPADSMIKEISTKQTRGQTEKYRPDTYYASGPERWFTTTGTEKGETLRPIQVLPDVNRTTTTQEYYGAGGNTSANEANYVKGEYEESKRNVLGEYQVTPAYAADKYNPTESDFGSKSFHILQNNRNTTKKQLEYGVVSGVVNAIVSPVLDALRPSRKENVIGNIRLLGNAGTEVPSNTIYNPSDRARTTIREMTGSKLDNNHLNVEGQRAPGHVVSEHQPTPVQRDTTTVSYSGTAGPALVPNIPTYNAAYNMQFNNTQRESENHPNQGGMQIFNSRENISIKRPTEDSYTHPSSMRMNGHKIMPTVETHGLNREPQTYNQTMGCERIAPDILNAFKSNPYTQSLGSHA